MFHFYDDADDSELYELRREWMAERRRKSLLAAHPDCRDPDHPGCEHCCDEEAEEQEEDVSHV